MRVGEDCWVPTPNGLSLGHVVEEVDMPWFTKAADETEPRPMAPGLRVRLKSGAHVNFPPFVMAACDVAAKATLVLQQCREDVLEAAVAWEGGPKGRLGHVRSWWTRTTRTRPRTGQLTAAVQALNEAKVEEALAREELVRVAQRVICYRKAEAQEWVLQAHDWVTMEWIQELLLNHALDHLSDAAEELGATYNTEDHFPTAEEADRELRAMGADPERMAKEGAALAAKLLAEREAAKHGEPWTTPNQEESK